MSSQASSLHAWLTSETPTSRRQARWAAVYKGWLSLKSNHMAMAGLAIIIALIAVAALAPWRVVEERVGPAGGNPSSLWR